MRRLIPLQKICLLVSIAAAAIAAATPAESGDVEGASCNPAWGGRIGLYFQRGEIHHSKIEETVGAFQPDIDLSNHWPIVLYGGVRYRKIIFDLELSAQLEPMVDFMDEYHFFSIDEIMVLLWCRRIMPFAVGRSRFRLLPGVGAGYSWAGATVGKYGTDYEKSETTKVLACSDFALKIGFDLIFNLFSDVDKSGNKFDMCIEFKGAYQAMGAQKAKTVNDGYIFFPNGSEFDFTGFYFGLGFTIIQ